MYGSIFIKFFLYCALLSQFSYAQYEKVKIGFIDSYYANKLTKEQLRTIIKEIEQKLEKQVGKNIFDYSSSGKVIDIIYQKPSRKKQNLDQSIKLLKDKKKKIETLGKSISSKQHTIVNSKKSLEKYINSLNNDINSLNSYITQSNKKKITSQEKYEQIKSYINKTRKGIQKRSNIYNQKKQKYNTSLRAFTF